MNVILVGFMGVGKSEVGKALASRLGYKYLDTDELIESSSQTSISNIFSDQGEEYFRELETNILKKLAGTNSRVISTGGGMVLRDENVEMLKKMGPLVLLTAREEVILERVREAEHRPLLSGDKAQKIKEILSVRNPIYNRVADLKVDTSDISPEEAVKEILKWLKK